MRSMYVRDGFDDVVFNGRRVANFGLGDSDSSTDKILQSVLIRFNVADSSQLPAEVLSKYRDAQLYLRDQATKITGGDAALGGALSSIAVNVVGSIVAGDPKAAVWAAWNGTLAVMAVAGGPVGAAVAGGLAVVMALLQQLPQAHGGSGRVGDACNHACGNENWYGGFILGKDMPPTSSSDPRWIRWDNKTPKKLAAPDIACSDDTPTSDVYTSCRNMMSGCGSANGNFTWLRTVLAFYPAGGFDHTLATQVKNTLELYLNAQGPMPTTCYGTPGSINLRDMADTLIRGWNATHEPGNVVTINYADHYETMEGFHNETYQQITDKALKEKTPWTGALAGYFIGMDSRSKGTVALHTGPPVKALRDLFTSPGAPPVGHSSGGGSSSGKKIVVGSAVAAAGGLAWYAHKHGLTMMQALRRIFDH